MPDPAAVNSMFARIARRYDLANVLLSGGVDRWWRKRLVAAVRAQRPTNVLDLATGSGDVALALGRGLDPATQIIGADFCHPMLDQAEMKRAAAAERYRNVTFQFGDGLALPFEDDRFDAITIAFGLRNLADRARGFREMKRVLRPGGWLFVLEFSQPNRVLRPLYYFYLRSILPNVAGMITANRDAYVYLNDTIGAFPDRHALTREVENSGLAHVHAQPLSFGIVALHRAQKPPQPL